MADPLEWLKEDIRLVRDEVKSINAKVDEMLMFKWQIVGGSIALSAIVGIIIQILLTYAAK